MAISDEITRLQTAKADLKTAIEGKGVTVPSSTKLDGYADLVDSIETGGGDNTDEWTYIKCDTLVTGTNPNAKAGTKFYIQYTNSSNLIVEFISTINYTTHTWGSNKLVSTEPTDSIDYETWYRIKPNGMSVGDVGTLTITQTTGTVVYTFKLIKTFSETTELDVSATDYGADIEKLNVSGGDSEMNCVYKEITAAGTKFSVMPQELVAPIKDNLVIVHAKNTSASYSYGLHIKQFEENNDNGAYWYYNFSIPTNGDVLILCDSNTETATLYSKSNQTSTINYFAGIAGGGGGGDN